MLKLELNYIRAFSTTQFMNHIQYLKSIVELDLTLSEYSGSFDVNFENKWTRQSIISNSFVKTGHQDT